MTAAIRRGSPGISRRKRARLRSLQFPACCIMQVCWQGRCSRAGSSGTLLDVLNGTQTAECMALLALAYLATIAAVQGVRCIKRLYVRRFANDINRRMKHMLYADLVHRSKKELDREGSGAVLTKAISDVDACAEGMRKFTTEIFDTGVVLVCYIGLLLWYDVKIALLSLLFPPLAYFAAERMKTIVQRTNAAFRSSAERLNAATLDRAAGALTYRIFGCDEQRNADYDVHLADYERCAVRANIWVSALPAACIMRFP